MVFGSLNEDNEKLANQNIIILETDEAKIISYALAEYIKNNPKKIKAKKIFKQLNEELSCW